MTFRRVSATLFAARRAAELAERRMRLLPGSTSFGEPPQRANVALPPAAGSALVICVVWRRSASGSPLCLDEVDSQLDEANTIRLRGLIQEMAPETQFIVITHSKTMMEAAETLYGVTMGEAGVSKLVSVRMADSRIAEMPQEAKASQTAVVA